MSGRRMPIALDDGLPRSRTGWMMEIHMALEEAVVDHPQGSYDSRIARSCFLHQYATVSQMVVGSDL